MRLRRLRAGLAIALAVALVGAGGVIGVRAFAHAARIHVVAYFDTSNALYTGDEVRILGVRVGAIDKIEAEPLRVRITFWFDQKYEVPADAKAAILSPHLVSQRAIQLTPAYTGGPVMTKGAVIPQSRTAVPLEWDDLREQLEKLTDALQPTKPGGVSTLGAFVNTAAANLSGQGANIRDTVIKLSQALSALGDHSNDVFSTIRNLALLVSALQDSTGLLSELNRNLAAVTAPLANKSNEVGQAVTDLDEVVTETSSFIAENREALGTSVDKLSSISTAVVDSLDDVKQALHLAPNALQNLYNIYNPAQSGGTGILTLTNFADPISFLCGAVQAASRLNSEQSAKLCVQYLAPIIKNRQYNFLPLGLNPFVGAQARPNEITYSEDWLRPDYVPPQPAAPPVDDPLPAQPPAPPNPLPDEMPAEMGAPTNPADGLPGMMVPQGGDK